MKKKVLICINSLAIGGSERSLVSLLNLLDYSKLEVDLIMLKRGEDFEQFIPNDVNILEVPEYYRYLRNEITNIKKTKNYRYLLTRYKTSICLRLNNMRKNPVNCEQVLYHSQKKVLQSLKQEYDIAIAYAQGYPTYFIADKVTAKRKIAWINCDYVTSKYDKIYDYKYYQDYERIIAVSNTVKESIIKANPNYKEKLEVILDIINPKIVKSLSTEFIPNQVSNVVNILTVGRLVIHHKGYDLAISAARLLKDNNIKFRWTIVGEGSDRSKIQKLIDDNQLTNEVILVGKKLNPYPYMKHCDIYVQPSRKEGLGLTVIEAKILKKPIICTNFNTATELINSDVDGLIVNDNCKDLFLGIKKFIEDELLMSKILKNLNKFNNYYTMDEIEKINQILY